MSVVLWYIFYPLTPCTCSPTVLAWSSTYSTFFVGTTASKIYQVFVSDNKMEIEDCTASMLRYDMCKFIGTHYQYFCTNYVYRDKCNSAGGVVAIVEPQTEEDKVWQTIKPLAVAQMIIVVVGFRVPCTMYWWYSPVVGAFCGTSNKVAVYRNKSKMQIPVYV